MREAVNLPSIEPHQRARRSAIIADHLKAMISSGQLQVGDRLPTEEKLCSHFNVSRTTLRESIQMLRASGILQVTPGRGSFVQVPDLDAMMRDLSFAGRYADVNQVEIYDLLGLLVQEVITQACEAGQDKKKTLHQYVIERDAGAEKNEELERLWVKQIAVLAGRDMTALLIDTFLRMKMPDRQEEFKDADHVMRVMQMQLRINAAIESADKDGCVRLIQSYIRPPVKS